MLTDAVYWAPRGTGRGGNNYSSAGVLVELPSGGEALLLAESLEGHQERGGAGAGQGDRLHHRGQEEYYGFDEDAFPERCPDGRVLMLLSYP